LPSLRHFAAIIFAAESPHPPLPLPLFSFSAIDYDTLRSLPPQIRHFMMIFLSSSDFFSDVFLFLFRIDLDAAAA